MRIVEKHSHLNGEEYLIVHHKDTYQEIRDVINTVDADNFKTKISKEKTMIGRKLYNPTELNKEYFRLLTDLNWEDTTYAYYVSTDYETVQEITGLPLEEQKEALLEKGITDPIRSYKQTDFVKNRIAVEVQFGKYAFVAYDLFVKHLLFYTGNVIDVGIEILPMMSMKRQMSTGIAYYEGEVYNVLRSGRNNPPVPFVIIGIAT